MSDPSPSHEADPQAAVPPPAPEKEEPPSPVAKGAKWGAIVGLVIAQIFIHQNSPLGFYTGNMWLVFATCIGLGTAIGAGFAWLNTQVIDDDERYPSP
jgi:hypothetical protein